MKRAELYTSQGWGRKVEYNFNSATAARHDGTVPADFARGFAAPVPDRIFCGGRHYSTLLDV